MWALHVETSDALGFAPTQPVALGIRTQRRRRLRKVTNYVRPTPSLPRIQAGVVLEQLDAEMRPAVYLGTPKLRNPGVDFGGATRSLPLFTAIDGHATKWNGLNAAASSREHVALRGGSE